MLWQLPQLVLVVIWSAGLPVAPVPLWQLAQSLPMRRVWLNGPTDGATVAATPAVLARVCAPPCAVTPPGRTARLSRELWQPEPPQSWPGWWSAPSRTHSRTPVFVFHFMPSSWQLMHFMVVT